jgi:GNAT superfamily N-acetyltransferase
MFKIKLLETDSERAFITKYWLDSYHSSAPIAKMIAPKVFFKWHKKKVIDSLDRWNTLLLCDDTDPDLLIGFMNYKESDSACYINYILVKESFRGNKLGKMLFNEAFEIDGNAVVRSIGKPLVMTHQGKLFGLTKYFNEVIFNPYLFYLI